MRLRPFIKIASRADQLTRRVNTDLISSLKNLTAKDIRSLMGQFVPLDFVALLQKHNPQAFEEALRMTIGQQLSTDQHKKWIEEAGLSKEDAVGETYISMLNDDPRRRGILSEILLDGSYSDAFQYARRSDPEARLQLRQSLRPLAADNGVVVPFCPHCKSLNIDHPLWNISVDNGQPQIQQGLDKTGRCKQIEFVENPENLTADQQEAIESGKREIQQQNGQHFLRCTYSEQLPKFQSFLHSKARQAVQNILNPQRQQMGRNIPPEKYRRRNELEQKAEQGTLTIQERSELRQIREYFQKKQKDYVAPPTSLDAPVGGSEGEGRSQHEMVADDVDLDEESINDAKIQLEKQLGENQFRVLAEVAHKIPLGSLMQKMQTIVNLPIKDPQRENLEKEVQKQAYRLSQKYYAGDDLSPNKCNTCGSELGSTSSSCPYADQMRSVIMTAYNQSDDIATFNQALEKLDQKPLEHFQASNITSIINNAFSGLEVTEDDLDLDLSGFESYEEEQTDQQKLDSKQFKQELENSLNDEQRSSYFGTDVESNEVSEAAAEKVNKLSKYLFDTINQVFDQELEDELGTYLIGHGAQ